MYFSSFEKIFLKLNIYYKRKAEAERGFNNLYSDMSFCFKLTYLSATRPSSLMYKTLSNFHHKSSLFEQNSSFSENVVAEPLIICLFVIGSANVGTNLGNRRRGKHLFLPKPQSCGEQYNLFLSFFVPLLFLLLFICYLLFVICYFLFVIWFFVSLLICFPQTTIMWRAIQWPNFLQSTIEKSILGFPFQKFLFILLKFQHGQNVAW